MEKPKILVVDDDELFRDSVVEVLRRKGCELDAASRGTEALAALERGGYDLIVADMKMPGMSGLELVQKIRESDNDIPFLMITAFGDVTTAVEAMKKGATDYIQKAPNVTEELEIIVEHLLSYRSLMTENEQLRSQLHKQWTCVGSCRAIREIRDLLDKVAVSRSTCLVSGESGTGKELIARAIHYMSRRRNGPFVKINCAALPEGLIESELFGHEKGAFTGALKQKRGKFELASGGTLLLDEIAEMPVSVQAKLLRVLQEREVAKVGGEEPVGVDVRVVATTNRDLDAEVSEGRFREDLYYRLNVFHINLPPLRERTEDIQQLAEHFVSKYNDENGFSVEGLDEGGMRALLDRRWPGNIRELENTIERAVVLTRSGRIPVDLLRGGQGPGEKKADAVFRPGMTVSEAEKELILRTLAHCGDNRTRAARMLGISIRTLRNKLNEYDLSAPARVVSPGREEVP